jgi:hypothetical protein
MDTRWLLMWIFAPILSPAALAVEAYGLRWYVAEQTESGGRHANCAR